MSDTLIAELRSSIGWCAGVGHERRRCAELLRARASHIGQLSEHFPRDKSYRMLEAELRRLADQIEEIP